MLPILPTTPFWLLTLYFLSRGSTRFHQRFLNSKLYQKHLQSFHETKTMTKRQKWRLMVFVDAMMFVSFLMVNIVALRILLLLLVAIKYWYFQRYVTVIPNPDKKGRLRYDASQ